MATLEFTEYVLARAVFGGQLGMPRGQESATQQVTIDVASTVSSPFGTGVGAIEITAVPADCRIAIGAPASVAAVNSGTFSRRLNAGHTYRFAVEPGQALAVIAIEGGAAADEPTASAGMATAAKQDTGNTSLAAIAAKQISGPSTSATSQSVVPSTDQNPIFDHANGTKTSVTSSATVITTGAGHTFLRISSDGDIFVNTAGSTAVDDGTSIRIVANQPEIIPVPPSTAIKALSSSGTAVVRCTPMKVR